MAVDAVALKMRTRKKPCCHGGMGNTMKINTRDFGVLEINAQEVIEFRLPIYGFEQLKRFVLLYDDTIPGPFSWLQSIEDEKACFILVDPCVVMPDYCPVLGPQTEKLLGTNTQGGYVFRTIAVIPEHFQDTTINLKSPIVINAEAKCAAQVILDEDYPVRACLVTQDAGEKTC